MTVPTDQAIRIAGQAASLWERLRWPEVGLGTSPEVSDDPERRLARWRHVVARDDDSAFQRRLAWDGLTPDAVRAVLARAGAAGPVPPWLAVLEEITHAIERGRPNPPAANARDPEHPRPFEDALLPVVHAARLRLHRAMRCLPSVELPRGPLSERAYLSLERGLLDRLCRACAQALLSDFSSVRPAGHSLLNALIGPTGTASTRLYADFVNGLLSSGLMPMFERYPVLARLVTGLVENWVTYCAEFQAHLADDTPLIERRFAVTPHGTLGTVVDLQFGLSDFHDHGRCVIGLTFSSGVKLAYKPKPLGIDQAFNQLVDWCNRQGLTLDLKTLRVIERPGYGWMEWVDQQPCEDADDVSRFYRRAGMLLALLHVLRATDCHHENVVAHGGHLVLVDGETLMVPDAHAADGTHLSVPNESFWQSVVRTGMLPQWETNAGASVPCDISALGGVARQQTPGPVPQWTHINTDDMDVSYGSIQMPRQRNAAMLGGVAASPSDHARDLVSGFSEMYGLLLRHRSALTAEGGPLDAFRAQPVRYVVRATEQYGRVLRHSLTPVALQSGCDRSIELDHLSRGAIDAQEPSRLWPVVQVEREALERLDVPRFEVLTDQTTLTHGGQAIAPSFFETSGHARVVERLGSLGDADLALQTRIIELSLHAWRARSEKHVDTGTARDGRPEAPSRLGIGADHRHEYLGRANAIAAEIASHAVRNHDGSVSWIGLTHVPAIGRYQVMPVDDGLYGGRVGIALFLAACDRVNHSSEYGGVVAGALQPLRALLQAGRPDRLDRYVRQIGIGIAEGVGGLVYALTCIASWRHEPALLNEAEMLAAAVTPDVIRGDQQFDVIGGAAGAIFGLAKLCRQRASPGTLRIVEDCAEWLCRHQHLEGGDTGGWPSALTPRPLTGYSHGASGIAAALAQVYAISGNTNALAAMSAALEFEHRAFLPDAGNWIDFRRHEPGQSPSCATSWCHGAPGIGLSRLSLSAILQHPLLHDDLEAALVTTQVRRPDSVDHLCCGTAGRVDILFHAGRTLGRPTLSETAVEQAWEMICRPEGIRLFPRDAPEVRNPGLFDGLAGIGYVLLRLAAPGALPCVLASE